MKECSQKVVPIRPEVGDAKKRKLVGTKQGSSTTVDVVTIGKLKFTVYTNTPTGQSINNFNESFQNLFEKSIASDESDAQPA